MHKVTSEHRVRSKEIQVLKEHKGRLVLLELQVRSQVHKGHKVQKVHKGHKDNNLPYRVISVLREQLVNRVQQVLKVVFREHKVRLDHRVLRVQLEDKGPHKERQVLLGLKERQVNKVHRERPKVLKVPRDLKGLKVLKVLKETLP